MSRRFPLSRPEVPVATGVGRGATRAAPRGATPERCRRKRSCRAFLRLAALSREPPQSHTGDSKQGDEKRDQRPGGHRRRGEWRRLPCTESGRNGQIVEGSGGQIVSRVRGDSRRRVDTVDSNARIILDRPKRTRRIEIDTRLSFERRNQRTDERSRPGSEVDAQEIGRRRIPVDNVGTRSASSAGRSERDPVPVDVRPERTDQAGSPGCGIDDIETTGIVLRR